MKNVENEVIEQKPAQDTKSNLKPLAIFVVGLIVFMFLAKYLMDLI